MDSIIKTCDLGGGKTATIRDLTSHYFGGYYHVRLQISSEVPVTADAFADTTTFEDALSRLGGKIHFSRNLEKMAVPEAEIENVRQHLLSSFDNNVLPYLLREGFAPGFVRSEYRKKCAAVSSCYR